MTDDRSTDPASPVPMAAQLTGEPLDPDQPSPSEVLPIGGSDEIDHLVSDNDA